MIILSIVILFLLILFVDFIGYERYKELEKRILELEVKNSELKRLMFNILDAFSKNGQSRTESECSDLQGNEKPRDTTNANI
jgi:hypothetical protein